VLRVVRPEIGEGLRAALGGRGGALVVAGGAVAVTAFVTAVVFAASLTSLLATPPAFGWPWDVAVLGNAGYGPIVLEEVDATLADRDDVEGWTALGFTSLLAVDGEPVFSMVWTDHDGGGPGPSLATGTLPAGDDEIALGVRTAAERELEVGDTVTVSGLDGEPRTASVTGLVVFPAVGPFQSDRGSPGSGMLVPATMFDAATGEGSPLAMGFLGVDLEDGAAPVDVLAALDADGARIDPDGDGLWLHDGPIRPPEIDDARSIRALPIVVGGLVGVAALIGLAFSMVVSVRSRRRELAILRSVGFTSRQIRWSVRAQTVAAMAAALVVGLPLGVVMGRLTWQAFAGRLGVVPDPTTPLLVLGLTVVGGLALALMAATIPARLAAATRPSVGLRTE
jgi:putative ABC transport system permease protein